MTPISTVLVAAIALVLTSGQAQAGLDPDVRCESNKLKTTGKYALCRLKTEAKAVAKGLFPDFTKCTDRFTVKFTKEEEKAGVGICPSEADVADIRDRTDDYSSQVAILLAGGSLPPTTCGDGSVGLGEDCDIGNLDGETCATQGFYNGTLACSPGCSFDTSGCNLNRLEDTGNTILDHETGLEWEKKGASDGSANLANPHDVDNAYTWAVGASASTQSGSAFSDFLFKLNGVVDHPTTTTAGCFEGHCDWRLPTVDELKSILSAGCGGAPCVIDAAFAPNRSGRYWTGSTRAASPSGAYFVDFSVTVASVASDFKTTAYFTRAVRTQ